MGRPLADSHREHARHAVHAHQRARREVLALDFCCGAPELASLDRAGDDAPGADSRLVVVRLRWQPTEWPTVGAVDHLGVEGELRPTLTRRPGQDLAHPEWLPAVRAGRRPHRRPGHLRRGPHPEVLLDATLAEYMAAAIESCEEARQAAAYCTHDVVGDAALHQLLFETLLEGQRIHFDAGESLGEPRRRKPQRPTRGSSLRQSSWGMHWLVLLNRERSLAGRGG